MSGLNLLNVIKYTVLD